jgi:PAS domain S-box-containing protein
LRESEEQYRDLFENANELIQSVSCEGRFLRVNKKWKDTLGYSEEDIANMSIWEIIDPEAASHCQEVFSQIFCGDRVDVIETTFIAKDGTAIPVEGTASCRLADGKPVSTRSIFRDIREKKRNEEEKNKLKSQLGRVQKLEAIGTLAGGVAHDFNNLLMTIQGNVSLMLLDVDPSNLHHKTLNDIENAVKNGAKLTRQLLGYARKGNYNVKPVNLNQIVEETSEAFGRTRKEIAIYLRLGQNAHSIEADQGQLEQVLLNLYVNAADAMPGGGDLVIATFNVSHRDMSGKLYNPKPGCYVKLTLTDTGIGIDKKTQERIFDPFFTTKEMGRGTGLGLASVYGIVKSHGGYIDVESEPASGTTFSIFLPASGKVINERVESPKQIIKGSGSILIVDDEEMVLNASAQMLKRLGYTVSKATGGKQAIESYKENKDQLDLVILDMIMPDISGSETFDKMKKINPDVKVLLSSGYSIEGQASEILSRGCSGFIQKPFGMKKLSETINEIIDS